MFAGNLAARSIPFCNPIEVFPCDRGATIEIDNVTIIVPPGAVPTGLTAHIEVGIALHGPFAFPKNYQPVSPVVWLCFQEDFELLLPLIIKLPHMVTDTSKVPLTFAKANHCEYGYAYAKEKRLYNFKRVVDGDSYFTNLTQENQNGYGTLHVKHCCLYCIHAKITPALAKSSGYCLHTLIEEKTPSRCRIVHVCTYSLKQCFKVGVKFPLANITLLAIHFLYRH